MTAYSRARGTAMVSTENVTVTPKKLWYEARALELSRGIHNKLAAGGYNDPMLDWAEELHEVMEQLKQMPKE